MSCNCIAFWQDVPSTSSAAAHSGPPRRAGAGVDGVTDSVAALHLSHNDRHALRASLAKGIQDLKDKEAAKKIIADDPLLNF